LTLIQKLFKIENKPPYQSKGGLQFKKELKIAFNFGGGKGRNPLIVKAKQLRKY
jgi:hypothetical protein